MAARTPTKRTFDIAVGPDDGLVGIRSAETGRVSLALSLEEASQVRSGLKEPSRPPRRSVRSRAPRKTLLSRRFVAGQAATRFTSATPSANAFRTRPS